MKTDEFRIDDLIAKLQEIRAEHGNLIVGTRHYSEASEDGYFEEYFTEAETAQVRAERKDGELGWTSDKPEEILRIVAVVGCY